MTRGALTSNTHSVYLVYHRYLSLCHVSLTHRPGPHRGTDVLTLLHGFTHLDRDCYCYCIVVCVLLKSVVSQGGRCGPNCTLVVSSPVGFNVRDRLQQTTIPSLGKASLSLDTNLFAIDPTVTKQKSTTVKHV